MVRTINMSALKYVQAAEIFIMKITSQTANKARITTYDRIIKTSNIYFT